MAYNIHSLFYRCWNFLWLHQIFMCWNRCAKIQFAQIKWVEPDFLLRFPNSTPFSFSQSLNEILVWIDLKVHINAVKWKISFSIAVFMHANLVSYNTLHSVQSNASSSFWSDLSFKQLRFGRFDSYTNPFHFFSVQKHTLVCFDFFRKSMLTWHCFILT